MISYQYDKDGFYAGAVEDYGLPPNNSTRIKPPLQEGYIPRWDGSIWILFENHKDEQGYVDGQPFTIKDYGPYPNGWSSTPPEPTEEEKKQQEIESIKLRLKEIDAESTRPLRAIARGSQTEEDIDKLSSLDAEADSLREQLHNLEGDDQ